MTRTRKQAEKTALRGRAEELLSSKPKPSTKKTKAEQDALIHELEVHQIELEMQNDELRKMQHELAVSYETITDLYDYAPVGYFSLDSKGVIIKANLTATELLGFQKRFLTGKPFTTLVYHDDRDAFHLYLRSLRAGSAKDCEIRLYKKDRVFFDAQLVSVPFTKENGDGGVIHIAIFAISERKEAQRRAADQMALLEAIIESSESPIFAVDRECRYICFNSSHAAAMRALFGADIRIGGDLFHYHTDSGNRAACKANIERTLRGETVVVESYAGESNRETRYFRIVHKPIRRAEGGAAVYANDLTERKAMEEELRESEKRYHSLFDNANESIFILDPGSGKIIDLNPCAANQLGFSREDLLGTQYRNFHVPDDFDRIDQIIRQTTLFENVTDEHLHRRKDGSLRIIEMKGIIVELTGRKVFQSICRDVTDRRNMERALQHYADELSIANKELESFSYSVAHDLRSPLQAITALSDVIIEDFSATMNSDLRSCIDRIVKNATRMNNLITDILSLSKLSRQEMNLQEVDMSAMAAAIVDDLRHAEPERKVEVLIAEDIKGYGDERLVRIALSNLLGNAWKYSGKTPDARIEFGTLREKDGGVIYYIRDNGAGFDMSLAKNLFTPFKRLHSNSQFPGTGIGLAIVSRVIQRHKGRVWAESEKDRGAAFYFTLLVCNTE